MSGEMKRYKVRGINGKINTVYARENGYIQDLLNTGIAVPSLPKNPNPAIYADENQIYPGYKFDPVNDQDALEALYGKHIDDGSV